MQNLETTFVQNGFVLDYWGVPGLPTHMATAPLVLDMEHNAAAIPGSGNTPVIFTHTRDLAKFVALMLDQDKWDPVTYALGDRVTWNEFLRLAEEAKGTLLDTKWFYRVHLADDYLRDQVHSHLRQR